MSYDELVDVYACRVYIDTSLTSLSILMRKHVVYKYLQWYVICNMIDADWDSIICHMHELSPFAAAENDVICLLSFLTWSLTWPSASDCSRNSIACPSWWPASQVPDGVLGPGFCRLIWGSHLSPTTLEKKTTCNRYNRPCGLRGFIFPTRRPDRDATSS